MSYTSLLVQTATRRRTTTTIGALGAPQPASTAEVSYACRVDNRGAQAATDGPSGADVTRWLIFLPATADVATDDELVIDSVVYSVVGVWPVQGRRGTHHIEATATRITP